MPAAWNHQQLAFVVLTVLALAIIAYQYSTRNQRRYSKQERLLMIELLKEAVQYMQWSEGNSDAFQAFVQAENALLKVQTVRRMVANENELPGLTQFDMTALNKEVERVRAAALQKLAVVCPIAGVNTNLSFAATATPLSSNHSVDPNTIY